MATEFSQKDAEELQKLILEEQENLTVITNLSRTMRDNSMFSRTLDSQVQAVIAHSEQCLNYVKEMDNILNKYYPKL